MNSDYEMTKEAKENLPVVEMISRDHINRLQQTKHRNFQALYDHINNVIYVNSETNDTGLDVILVHELVHYLQNLTNKKFGCQGQAEAEAYEIENEFTGDISNANDLGLLLMSLCDHEMY